ncbi:hypothetical protein MABM_17510 [Mycobacteroides abscessus]|uniref:Replicative helicase inhibitor G39P N-terminal domain-containing protein n=1 Tax=Mycobacteroides abscessus subsp. bolletii 50594 TaxID=1303024 RepID=A0AB33A8S2_9MYCO|nr:hypothetical protein [Mycobacteroides abscessus]AGM28148.1 hypothetical protein MASS_1546 [Mycobacteroides abscessus subsp. bolletii 50594]BBZ81835.1 hypothetical protein MABM_17510 [Mycobacteroides abscessus]
MNYPQMAALVLAKCVAYDPYLTEPTEEMCRAWAEQFELYKLELDDVMAAVTKVYSQHGSGYRPLPKDFTDAARARRRDRAEREKAQEIRDEAEKWRLDAERRGQIEGFIEGFGETDEKDDES